MRIAGFIALVIFFPAFAHAAIVIDEIMYEDGATHDWIEVKNNGASAVDIKSFRFFEANTNHGLKLDRGSSVLPAGGYAVIANATSTFLTDFPSFSGNLFDSSFDLNSMGEPLRLCSGVCDESNTENSLSSYTPFGATDKNKGYSLQLANGNWIAATPTPGVINSGVSDPSNSGSDTSSNTTSATTETNSANSAPPEYLSIPMLHINTVDNHTVSSGADTAFTATVYDGKGNKRDDAVVSWSFGDGMRRTGASVFHQYYSSGEYLAIVRAITTDGGNAQKEVAITVKDASIKISSVSPRGIALTNTDSRTLDLSLWRLSAGGQEFKIPEDTQILAGRTILFPSQVIELPLADVAFLLYPSGEVAATYGAGTTAPQSTAVVQLHPVTASYEQVQKVEPIISTKEIVPAHDEAVIAPRASNELAALGAALPLESAPASRTASIFKSPWTLGFIGTVLLAGGAFIFL